MVKTLWHQGGSMVEPLHVPTPAVLSTARTPRGTENTHHITLLATPRPTPSCQVPHPTPSPVISSGMGVPAFAMRGP